MPERSSASDPMVSLNVNGLERRIADAAKANSITTNAGWATAVATAFSAANCPGVGPVARAALIALLSELPIFTP